MWSTLLSSSLFLCVVLTRAQSLYFEGFSSSVLLSDTISTIGSTLPSPASSIIVTLPTLLPCSDPSWHPTPENWAAENVDQELANTKGLWGSGTTFVEYIAQHTGQTSQRCGIGYSSTCTVPDCTAFQGAGGEKWVYFVAVSIVEMNSFLNIMNDGINSGTTELSLVIGDMANSFFPWEPQPSHTNIWPWIEAALSSVLAFVPLFLPAKLFGSAISQSAAAFANGGLATLSPHSSDPEAYYLGTMQQLGETFKTLSYNATSGLDQWSQKLFGGEPDESGKTIIDYFAGGRFTLSYNISDPTMENFYFQTMVSDVVNDQWRQALMTAHQGVWTIPVCDVGENGNWVANYEVGAMPCCCGPLKPSGQGCTETDDFIIATHLIEFGEFYTTCKTQYPGFIGPSAAVGLAVPFLSTLLLSTLVTVLLGMSLSG
ncbi:uncharacterized protein BDZ99DRAFT_522766 [Mytilinidion resinicola]|uniref:Uncharacterized protein n=1 Tax=Mytilinidion resinicola TaxID=574789 RepID=A0A6A6YGJ9_9PEZI|nr:uncharacterized protein BDZ99DRAFT_522766 [Mytilinidion resinicola]KAF2807134.1 hypothetical protein BDZ99DRAFT_522766 [Mytilinidion resinicola]